MTTLATLQNNNGLPDLPSQEIAHAIAGTMEQLKAIRTFIKEEFDIGFKDREGRIIVGKDAGIIPGCGDKPTLFLPGAQKATMYFNCYPTYKIHQTDLGGGHVTFRVRCILISRATREQVGEGIGCCSTMEKKYRWRGNERVCPLCQKPTIRKSKDKPEFYCWRKIDGCGATFKLNHPDIVSQGDGSPVENPDLYDLHNTALKMAKKRAHVDAAMTLGCLSEMFTQDIEDTYAPLAVRDAARPYDGEVIDVEPAAEHRPEPDPPKVKSAPGLFSEEHQKKVPTFLGWLKAGCSHHIKEWRASWGSDNIEKWGEWFPLPAERAARFLEDGFAVPAKIDDPINTFQAKGHLWKWAVGQGLIEGVTDHRGAKPAQIDAFLTTVYGNPAQFAAMRKEMGEYVAKAKREAEAAIYRDFTHLAPDGFFQEQDEAMEAAKQALADSEATIVPDDEDESGDVFGEGRE